MSFFKLGKITLSHKKNTADMQPVRLAVPKSVLIPLSQHIGEAAIPVVKAGDKVCVGTLIGEANGYVSAPAHSSVSGTVKKIDEYMFANGKLYPAVLIETDGEQTLDKDITPPTVTTAEELYNAVRASGLVGLGGAAFPTSVKLDARKVQNIDTLIVNAAECEPYITSDTRTMLDNTDYVKAGVLKIMELTGIKSAVIGIEKNKPTAVKKIKEVFAGDGRVRIEVLPATYPQGAEKVLIYNSTGRIVPEGKLPVDVGVLVLNVSTVAFIAKYLESGIPLVEKCVTVDGSAIKNPQNVIVPVGMLLGDVIEATGGFSSEPKKVIFGGPMMGNCADNLSSPVMKNTNAVIAFNESDAVPEESTACIHCGRCVSVCPMGLNPTVYAKALKLTDRDEKIARLEKAKINLCVECGCCSYICPARRPLVENNRLAKSDLRAYKNERQNKEGESK